MSIPSTRDNIITVLGYFWTDVFLDSEFVQAFATSFAVPFEGLNELAFRMADYLNRDEVPALEPHAARIFIFDEEAENRDANRYGEEGLVYGGDVIYGEQNTSAQNRRFPIDPAFSPKFLTVGITEPSVVLRLGEDYSLDSGNIIFFEDPLAIPGIAKNPKMGEDGSTLFDFFLWGFQVEEDINAVCTFFGTMAGICDVTNKWTEEAVQVAWDLRVHGATAQNLKRVLGILTRTDYVHTAGNVQNVFTEGDRVCVALEEAVYTAPASAAPLVNEGDAVVVGQTIFDAYAIRLGNEDIPFEDFEGLALGPEYLPSVRGELLFVNDRVPIEKEQHPGWFTLQAQ